MFNFSLPTRIITTFFFIAVTATANSIALADDRSAPLLSYFHVRQEISQADGVLVSRPMPEDKRILDLLDLQKIRSLEDYTSWLQKNIRYQKEIPGDAWPAPEKALRQRHGDCKEFASLNSAVVRVMGYEPHLLAMVAKDQGHAVCVFKKDGYYVWLDNMQIKNTGLKSLTELARHFTTSYHYFKVLELNPDTQQWHTLFQES